MPYLLQSVDLGAIAGAQSQPFAQGIPIASVMVIAAPTGYVATIQDAQTQLAIPLPPAGQGLEFCDAIGNGLVVIAPKGQAGQLVLGLNLKPAGFSSSQPSGRRFKGSASAPDLGGANQGAVLQLVNPAGSGIVATVTRRDVQGNVQLQLVGTYVGADVGDQGPADDGDRTGRAIQPAAGGDLAAGVLGKCVYRIRRDGATSATGFGIPGTATANFTGDLGQLAHRAIEPAGAAVSLVPGQGLITRSRGVDANCLQVNDEWTEQ